MADSGNHEFIKSTKLESTSKMWYVWNRK